jgi:nucleoside-diphosphate-sugar epimerase
MTEISTPRRVAFLTGGSGFVGGQLIKTLTALGWEIRALARSAEAMATVRKLGAIPIQGELDDVAALEKGMRGSDIVFHIAARFELWGDRRDFDKVNVEGMRKIVDAAASTPSVRKVVAVSAAAVVMGDPGPMVAVDESSPVQMPDFAPYSSSKAEGEKVLLAGNGRRPGFETIAIRPPMIWGAGMPMLDEMAHTVKAGNWQWVDGGVQAMSTCHIQNLISALLLAADHGRGGEAYFVADAEEGTLKSVVGGLLATRDVHPTDKSVAFGMAWTMAGLMAMVWRLFRLKGQPPITRQMLRLIGKPFTISTRKAQKELGYRPVISWEQGVAQMRGR